MKQNPTHRCKGRIFNFLGFTVRYDKDIKGRDIRYWNIDASDKSEQKIRENIKEYLSNGGHYAPQRVAAGLNTIIRGWLNYFDIPGVSYPALNKRQLRPYLYKNYTDTITARARGKVACMVNRLLRFSAKYALINPMQYFIKSSLVKACNEDNREAVCGKTARTV